MLAVVGNGMAGTPGIAARVFSSLAEGARQRHGHRPGQLRAEHLVRGGRGTRPARRRGRVHAAFQLSKIGGGQSVEAAHSDVVLLGFGRVGRALADQIAAQDDGSPVRVVGLLDRSGYVFDPGGLARAIVSCGSPRARTGAGFSRPSGGERAGAAAALRFIASHAVSRPDPGGRHRRGDRRSCCARPRPGLRPRAGQQEAAGGLGRKLQATARGGARGLAAHPLRGHGGGRAARARHLPQADGERRPHPADRGRGERHPGLRALRGVRGPALLRGGARGDGAAATPSPIRATISRARTWRARA